MTAAAASVIHSVRLAGADGIVADGWVRFAAGRVVATGTSRSWTADADTAVLDGRALAGEGAILSPGFIDIHGHGGAGVSYDDGPAAIRAARALHREHGTTRAVLSLVTAPLAELEQRAAMVADLAATDADVLGSHLEGPFLDPGHKGAHDAALLRAPDADGLDRLLSAGRGTIRQITLAPELPGGLDAIGRIVEAGVVAAVGHTAAAYDLCRAAFDAGATVLTHAFNAMPGLHHRDPGPVAAAAGDPRVTLEVIADGVHLHPEIVRLAFAAAPGRVALVTDAMAAAGHSDGHYVLGKLGVDVQGGVARLTDGGAIAGSTLTQDAALRTAVGAGVGITEALTALTTTPARAIGRGDDLGRLAPGFLADAVLLDGDLTVRGVWTAGERSL
ncbi:N-acetylglucosamine-6-phosphate deacetylase [Microbacterium terricola]|uniref:N-acetylglucosamine-6-phosphate deacetylase n=1 Tax=Microbacterium terricola TaxID=344163 RepID=A0ABM8DWE6_9MICO|nr:N-acetylglucosamine-6-phosphate deacetylase [Microbacterium terricola]UYK39336.1 N-acetylglucosamine-6-phosphate deacetylase [Microbacterium terricola]BDV29941.1 N-acetylglucosamine-6-phosphate deacetylase [Microbacterium terricola]